MKYLFVLALAALISLASVYANPVYANPCLPGYIHQVLRFSDGNGCEYIVNTCVKFNGVVTTLDIEVGEIEMKGGCCQTRAQILETYRDEIIIQSMRIVGWGYPACPAKTLVIQLYPGACATECINTGCYRTWSDGSQGIIFKSWACASNFHCRFLYTACCSTGPFGCPPDTPTIELLGVVVLNNDSPCTTTTVNVCSSLDPVEIVCHKQCQP